MNVLTFNIFLAFASDMSFQCCILPIIFVVIAIICVAIQQSAEKERTKERAKLQAEEHAKWQEEQRKKIENQKRSLSKAQEAYYSSLDKLKSEPINADLKQDTLQLGRTYSEKTREFEGGGKITIYDEVALMNDINAVCAGASVITSQTFEERLSKLLDLKEKNLISEEEFETRRQKILDEI